MRRCAPSRLGLKHNGFAFSPFPESVVHADVRKPVAFRSSGGGDNALYSWGKTWLRDAAIELLLPLEVV